MKWKGIKLTNIDFNKIKRLTIRKWEKIVEDPKYAESLRCKLLYWKYANFCPLCSVFERKKVVWCGGCPLMAQDLHCRDKKSYYYLFFKYLRQGNIKPAKYCAEKILKMIKNWKIS